MAPKFCVLLLQGFRFRVSSMVKIFAVPFLPLDPERDHRLEGVDYSNVPFLPEYRSAVTAPILAAFIQGVSYALCLRSSAWW
jgi:hypothetical protein